MQREARPWRAVLGLRVCVFWQLRPDGSIQEAKMGTFALQLLTRRFAALGVALVALQLFNVSQVWAQERAVPSGGLQVTGSKAILALEERVHLSPSAVRVAYRFQNRLSRTAVVRMSIPMPSVQWWEREYPTIFDTKYLDLRILVKGVAIEPVFETRAFFRGRDVTEFLLGLGVPVSWGEPTSVDSWPAPSVHRLRHLGMIRQEVREVMDDESEPTPQWKLNTKIHWDQRFEAKEEILVELAHSPIMGMDWVESRKKYCMAGLAGPPHSDLVHQESMAVSPKLAVNGRTVPVDLTVFIHPGPQTRRFSTCVRGLKKQQDGSWQTHLRRYHSSRVIKVLWFEDWDLADPD